MTLRASFAKAIELGTAARLKTDTRAVTVNVPPARAFEPVRRVGGAAGWYCGNSLWKARDWVDRLLGGGGMHRGRRDPDVCEVETSSTRGRSTRMNRIGGCACLPT
jgi:hypothetical protein